ncbi:MAG: metallophosphoesterase [Theionarchaea archaeon]|nr:metallophosphoesterase [Theionarchaea archaeon]MBU6999808.1 metallophosphoesterase [Theionarchaea archaeon]MBU7033653.1 metallophosphoesterase [Theionarchaea archaeon]
MSISMKRWYVLVAAVGVAALILMTGYQVQRTRDQYPVYKGRELFGDTYPFTFVFFGDCRPTDGSQHPEVFITMLGQINELDPLFVVGGGDFVFEGTPHDFEAFLETVSVLKPPLLYVCGNHDDSPYYSQHLGDRVYAITYRNALFVILDNSRKVLNESQLEFLENQLKRGVEHTFVFMHVPPLDPQGTYCMIHPEEFLEIVQKYHVDYVFCSHIHHLYEEDINGTTLIVSGGAGSSLTRQGFHHYIVVRVGDEVTYEVIPL